MQTSQTLKGGFTPNQVQRHHNGVVKSGEDLTNEIRWYDSYKDRKDIPKVEEFRMTDFGDTLPFNLESIIKLVEKYKNFPRINTLSFQAYYERILFHVERSELNNGYKIIEHLKAVKLEPTFAHGDLSTRNIIFTATGPKLIDPIYNFRTFGSYILDYAKLAFSLKFYDNDVETFDKLVAHVSHPHMDILIASECVRVATYRKQFNFVCENLINEL